MKVVCIRVGFRNEPFKGKIYECSDDGWNCSNHYITLTDSNGKKLLYLYLKSNFRTLEEYREEQLATLLETDN